MTRQQQSRCNWCERSELYRAYHDQEWGVPVYDDQTLFEFLTLEGAQAGLSWITVLKKRDAYRTAFADFDVQKVARFNSHNVERLMKNKGIIRNRLKITSTINNAKRFIDVQQEFNSFSNYLWSFIDHKPIQNHFKDLTEVPASTGLSDKISKDMKKRGFTFFGTTICYATMQATGMVNDHIESCFRYKEIATLNLQQHPSECN